MQRGSLRGLPDQDAAHPEGETGHDLALVAPRSDGAVEFQGFNLQAGVRIAAARPPRSRGLAEPNLFGWHDSWGRVAFVYSSAANRTAPVQ